MIEPGHDHRRPLPGDLARRLGRDGRRLPAPRTSCSGARSRSRCCTTTSPKTRSSSSASGARPRAPPALSHPNIVGIFDRGEWNGTYYIAMEYLAGRSLKAIVREQGAARRRWRRSTSSMQILRAARFAHRRGVIHRDLKPHNVILDEEGRAKVTDFGIARAGRLGHDADRVDHGHRPVPLARAGPGPRRQRRLGPLLDRGDPVRAADRRGARSTATRPSRSPSSRSPPQPPAAERAQPGGAAGAGRDRAARARQGSRRSASPTPTSSSPALARERERLRAHRGDRDLRDARRRRRGARAPIVPPGAAPHRRACLGALLPGGRAPHERAAAGRPRRASARRRRGRWSRLVGVAAALVVVGGCALALLLAAAPAARVTVPSVVGQNERPPIATLRRAGCSPVPRCRERHRSPSGWSSARPRRRAARAKGSTRRRSSSPAARRAPRSRRRRRSRLEATAQRCTPPASSPTHRKPSRATRSPSGRRDRDRTARRHRAAGGAAGHRARLERSRAWRPRRRRRVARRRRSGARRTAKLRVGTVTQQTSQTVARDGARTVADRGLEVRRRARRST